MKYRVWIHQMASGYIDVGLEDDDPILEIEEEDELYEIIVDKALNEVGAPNVCAQCSGWGSYVGGISLDGEWEVDTNTDDGSPVVEILEDDD